MNSQPRLRMDDDVDALPGTTARPWILLVGGNPDVRALLHDRLEDEEFTVADAAGSDDVLFFVRLRARRRGVARYLTGPRGSGCGAWRLRRVVQGVAPTVPARRTFGAS